MNKYNSIIELGGLHFSANWSVVITFLPCPAQIFATFFKYLPLFVPPHCPDETCPLTTWPLIFATALINKQTSVVQRTSTFMRNKIKGT